MRQTITIKPEPFSFDVDIPEPAPAMPAAEGESRVSQFDGDVYAAAADAENGGQLVIDHSVTLDAGRPLVLRNILARGLGRGSKCPVIGGPVQVSGDWGELRDVTIAGGATNVALTVRGANVGVHNLRIRDSKQSMVVLPETFYGHFTAISAVIGCQKGLNLSTPAGSGGDNGQFSFDACKFGGGDYALKRDPPVSSTMHRIWFGQTQFIGGYSGDYIVDALGLGTLTLDTCDVEVSGQGPAKALVRLGGLGQLLDNCLLSFPVNAGQTVRTKKGIVTNPDYGLKAKLNLCGFDYAPAGSTMITTATGVACEHNFFGVGKGSGASLYDGAMKGWVQGEDVGLWIGGRKVA